MQKIYRIILSLIILSNCVGVMQAQEKNVADEVIWVVGDEAILKSQVEEQIKQLRAYNERIEGDPYCVVPENMAISKLYLNQAKIDSVTVSESEIRSMVEKRIGELITLFGSREKLEEYQNMSLMQIREFLTDMMRENQVIKTMQEKLTQDVKVTPAEVRRYFKDLPQDSIPFIPTQVEVQIITMEPKIPQEEIERVKKTLRDYTERVTSGEIAFSTLARLYSEDEGSRRRGGELGFMGRAELVPEYANVAFNLQDPNKVSKIVEPEFGFHISQLSEKRGDRINTRHSLLKPKVDEKDLEAALLRLDSIANDIRNEKFTFDDAATYISHDKDTRNNHGLMANPQTGTARFEMQQLAQVSQEAAKMVEGMNVGEISTPFTMINAKGKEICAIVKLKTRLNGHKATITEDYQRLKGIVMEKRSEEKLDKWIKDKQKHTYVRINEKWQKCDFKYPGWVKK